MGSHGLRCRRGGNAIRARLIRYSRHLVAAVVTFSRSFLVHGLHRSSARRRALVSLLLACCVSAAPAQNYRFAAPSSSTATPVSANVLTPDERAFIAALPEVRVAVPLPPSRPYEAINADGLISGIHPEMLMALAQTFGIRLKPVVTPDWSSALAAVRAHEVDVVMTLGVTAERMEYLAFTLGASPLPGALFARTGMQADPAKASFALERNYMANDWVRRQYPEATIQTVDTTIDALRAVGAGQADYYLGSLLEATDWLAREPVPGVELNRMQSFGTGYYHFAVRKDWAPLAAILNKGIQSLRTTTAAELAAALGGLPKGASIAQPLELNAAESSLLASKPIWRVGAVQGLALLNDIDEQGRHSGIAAEYAEQVARRLGVAIQPVPFKSVATMLDALRKGDIDLVPFLTRTPQRAAEFDFSKPYVEMPYVLVARSDDAMYWGLDSLRGRRLALAAQHPLRDLLSHAYPDIQIVDAENGTDAMDRVVRHEADAAVEVKLFANLRINGDADGPLRAVAEVKELPAQFGFAAARSTASMLPLVDRALADIGPAERTRMLRRWVAADLNPPFPWKRYATLIAVATGALLALVLATVWWMRRLAREVDARRRSEQLLNDIATTVPGLAFRYVLNDDGSLRHHFFTPGATAFLGIELDPQRTVLSTLGADLPAEQVAQAKAAQAHSFRTGEPFKFTWAYPHPDGRTRWLHTQAVRTRSASGRSVWTGYVVDVSTERELQARLASEAESRNLMLASASHELRAPTQTLSLALQSLPQDGLNEQQSGALRIARDSARTLAELLDDVLDAARSGHEPLQLRPRTFDLHALLDHVAGAWRSAAATKGLQFEIHISPAVPRTVSLDPVRLKQVLTNLLSNACKYTVAGQVTLRAERSADETLRFSVSDTGKGIAPADQKNLFEPYVTLQEPGAPGAAEGSTGLGLFMSRRVAHLMGGEIELDSEPGKGTQVTLTVPLPRSVARSQGSGNGKIVVCDDDETSRLLMVHMLSRHGFDVHETGDGREALDLCRSSGASALVTDWNLPGMDGRDLIQALRDQQSPSEARTAVIVCSGNTPPTSDAPHTAGLYDAYLIKPIDVRMLIAAMLDLGLVP